MEQQSSMTTGSTSLATPSISAEPQSVPAVESQQPKLKSKDEILGFEPEKYTLRVDGAVAAYFESIFQIIRSSK